MDNIDGFTSDELNIFVGKQIYNGINNNFFGAQMTSGSIQAMQKACEDYLYVIKNTIPIYPNPSHAEVKVKQDTRDPSKVNIDFSLKDPYMINYIIGNIMIQPNIQLSKNNMDHNFVLMEDKNRYNICSACGLKALIFPNETLVYIDMNCNNYILKQVL